MYKYLLLYQKGYEQNAHIPFTIIIILPELVISR